jgi:hypothetical protein
MVKQIFVGIRKSGLDLPVIGEINQISETSVHVVKMYIKKPTRAKERIVLEDWHGKIFKMEERTEADKLYETLAVMKKDFSEETKRSQIAFADRLYNLFEHGEVPQPKLTTHSVSDIIAAGGLTKYCESRSIPAFTFDDLIANLKELIDK